VGIEEKNGNSLCPRNPSPWVGSVQVGSRSGDTCATSELRLSAVVEVVEEADEARRLSRRTSRKVNCKAKRGTRGPSLKTTQWRLR